VAGDHSAGDWGAAEPAVLVELADCLDRYMFDRKAFGQLPEAFGQVDGSAAGNGACVSFRHRAIVIR
jgi:hypothetical protein